MFKLIVCALILYTSISHAQIVGESGKNFIVEAEGQGETKLQAMKAAWSDAVRIGVGMYLTSKDTLVDDDLREEIITHSRGQVDSYELLSEKKGDTGWTVRIRAKIEKDILREGATVSQEKTKTVKVDTSNLAAKRITTGDKKGSAIELLENFNFPPKEELVIYDFSTKIENNQLIIAHHLKFNDSIYKKFIGEFASLLDKVASGKEELAYSDFDIKSLTAIMKGKGDDCLTSVVNAATFNQKDGRIGNGFRISYVYRDISTYMVYILQDALARIIDRKVKMFHGNTFQGTNVSKCNIITQAIDDEENIIAAINTECTIGFYHPRSDSDISFPMFYRVSIGRDEFRRCTKDFTSQQIWKGLDNDDLFKIKSIKSTLKMK
jgi:hypothetical protein